MRMTLDEGFSLVEMLVAVAILASGVVAVAGLCVTAARANHDARGITMATAAAAQKMEQLRALALGYDALGLPMTDTTSDISRAPAAPGGTGLLPSPPGTLIASTPGYVDYVDQDGQWVGTGTAPVAGAAYVRRWSVAALASDPANAVVLQVVVTAVRQGASGPATPVSEVAGGAQLVSVKMRKHG
jgi:prepilin-type N-terminal cleavage/methylation domain-containing protein